MRHVIPNGTWYETTTPNVYATELPSHINGIPYLNGQPLPLVNNLIANANNLPEGSCEIIGSTLYTIAKNTQENTGKEIVWSIKPTLIQTETPIYQIQQYINPQFAEVDFGKHSHYLQPWRAYLETFPAQRIIDGLGICFNPSDNPKTSRDLLAQYLASKGFKRARVEISWNQLDVNDKLKDPEYHSETLTALRNAGIRPLLLLNANHGDPCPSEWHQLQVLNDTSLGSNKVRLSDTSKLRINYSGISWLEEDAKLAGHLISAINGNEVTLFKPLPKGLIAGETVVLNTLKYLPFGNPLTSEYQASIEGWRKYTSAIAEFAYSILGDGGFDLEVWNEMSFGSYFLYRNSYYPDELRVDYNEDAIWQSLVNETASLAVDNPQIYSGVEIINGFGSTLPWIASSQQPARITGICKHPYTGLRVYPKQEPERASINALGEEEENNKFIPTYNSCFPEYWANYLQTESYTRQSIPIESSGAYIGETKHGRLRNNGSPVFLWFTECNICPTEQDKYVTANRAFYLKAKCALRYLCFDLNKGAKAIYFFVAEHQDIELAVVSERLIQAISETEIYPQNDSLYNNVMLEGILELVNSINSQIQPITIPKSINVLSVGDNHNHYQFLGDGTPQHPNLFNRDVLAILPYQLSNTSFCIPYYVMSRNILLDLNQEAFYIKLEGVNANEVWSYDPLTKNEVSVDVLNNQNGILELKVLAVDYPRLLYLK